MKRVKLLYLYRELMPYNIQVLISLAKMEVDILVIHNDKNKLTPYVPKPIENVIYIKKSSLNKKRLFDIALEFNADVVYISDRTIWDYNRLGIRYRMMNKPVISGNDTQWNGGKKWINIFTAFFRHHRYFSHMQVAGFRQYEYAKKLGFKNDKIVWPMYSADVSKFNELDITLERFSNGKDILFVGRLNKTKGLKYLLEGWRLLDTEGSILHLVGNGDFLDNLDLPENIRVHSFSDQDSLVQLAKKCRAFILPSLQEPWGVVLHEFAAAGLPLIATNVCGASDHFIINNANGFVIKPRRSDLIAEKINWILNAPPTKLFEMGLFSRELSKSISPKRVAQAILSVIDVR